MHHHSLSLLLKDDDSQSENPCQGTNPVIHVDPSDQSTSMKLTNTCIPASDVDVNTLVCTGPVSPEWAVKNHPTDSDDADISRVLPTAINNLHSGFVDTNADALEIPVSDVNNMVTHVAPSDPTTSVILNKPIPKLILMMLTFQKSSRLQSTIYNLDLLILIMM